jgi:hypothetical protein
MPVSLTKPEDREREVERLRALLELAEAHQQCRFAMVQVGLDTVVLTTSGSEPTDFERTILACFAQHAFSLGAALNLGIARGIALAQDGEPKEEWCAHIVDLHDRHLNQAAASAMDSIALTRIAMAPFGLQPAIDEESTIWQKAPAPAREKEDR